MILIAGGTGMLGTQVVRMLITRGLPVRIMTRDVARARQLAGDCVEIVEGDVRDSQACAQAVLGVGTVISAIQGLSGSGGCSPQTVDRNGNSNLIQAARTAGAEHFILVSAHDAAPEHPLELFRMKYFAEQELQASGLAWTIIRPTAYMETWARLLGEALLVNKKTQIFGRGINPINFVSVYDVARFIELAVMDPAMRGTQVEIGGPENLTMQQFVQTFETVTGHTGSTRHVPLPLMRLMAVLMRPLNPAVARLIQAGVVMDTQNMAFNPSETTCRYPSITLTSLAEVIQRDYVDGK